MPIYEYVCEECSATFEKLVNKVEEEVRCPGCNSERLSRQYSRFGTSQRSRSESLPLYQGGCGCSSGGCGCKN